MVVRSLLPKTLGLTKNGTVPGDFNVTLKSVGWARITSPSTQLQVATSIKQRMATYKHRSFTASLPLKKGGTDWQTLLSFLGHRNFSGTGWGSRTCNIMLYPWLLQVGDVYALKSREKKTIPSWRHVFFDMDPLSFEKTLPSKIVTKSWVYRIAHEKGGFLYKRSISCLFQTSEPSFNIWILQNFPWNRNSRKMKPYM